jgi:hypothetical protein
MSGYILLALQPIYDFIKELLYVFPGSYFYERKNYPLKKICECTLKAVVAFELHTRAGGQSLVFGPLRAHPAVRIVRTQPHQRMFTHSRTLLPLASFLAAAGSAFAVERTAFL